MTITAAQLRVDYPEFSNTTTYPDSQVNYWLNVAVLLLNASRWSTLLDTGTELFVAHNLVLEAQAQASAANGAPPGVTTGPVSNKSVDKVSVGYDVAAGTIDGAGPWNLTIYGTRFIKLALMLGAGPVQVGVSCGGPLTSADAWAGPFAGIGWY